MTSKPANDMRAALRDISAAAATASVSRVVLIERIKAFADHPTADDMKRLQAAVILGYCAGRIGRAAGRDAGGADDMAAAATMLAKAGAGAAKAGKAGKRTADEERIYGDARVYWAGVMAEAGAAPEAGTNAGRAVGGKALGAKRTARTIGGTVDVTPPRAAPAKEAPAQPAGKDVTPLAAMAHVHAAGATLMAYLESHAELFLPRVLAGLKKNVAAIQAAPVPTH